MKPPPHDHSIPSEFSREECFRCRWNDRVWNWATLALLVLLLALWVFS